MTPPLTAWGWFTHLEDNDSTNNNVKENQEIFNAKNLPTSRPVNLIEQVAFSTAVGHRAFNAGTLSVTLSVPALRILETTLGKKMKDKRYCEYLVVLTVNGKTTTRWTRHSDFATFMYCHSKLPYAIHRAWYVVLGNTRWGRCLEMDYLQTKHLYLKEFVQAVLFESFTIDTLYDLVQVPKALRHSSSYY